MLDLLVGASMACAAVSRVDDFSEGGWRAANAKAPALVETSPGRLLLRDLPGGEVTWGSSAARRFPDFDVQQTPYLVIDLARMTGSFQVKLSGDTDWPKQTVCTTAAPGTLVIDIAAATGWKTTTGRLTVMVYALGDGCEIELTSLMFTDTLSEQQRSILQAGARPPPPDTPHAGLTALAARTGNKPITLEAAGSERAIYRDPVSGNAVWRLTDHPAIERHVYYDILAWNANGSLITWISRRPGGTYWLMDAAGANLRPLPQPADGGPMRAPHWSPTRPEIMYFARAEGERTRILTLNVHNGAVSEVVSVPFGMRLGERTFSEFPPPHPDEHHFLLRWGGQDKLPTFLLVVNADTGQTWELETDMPTHRVRFTKHADRSVFFNSNTDPDLPGQRARSEWILSLDGSKRRLPKGGGHPDWSPDGAWLAVFRDGGIWLTPHDGSPPRELIATQAGGHGGFSITTGQFHVADAPRRGPYANMVFVTDLQTGIATPIAYHGASYSAWSSTVPDPEATHPAPICSPDETKIIYDSDLLGQPDLWFAVWKRPGRPRNVTFANGRLSWTPPKLHREIATYAIYRYTTNAWRFLQCADAAANSARLEPGRYAVAAREWSGLESLLSVAGTDAIAQDTSAPARPEPPFLADSGITHITLSWPQAPDADAAYYNVYRGTSVDAPVDRATLVGSPTDPRMTDWGLQPATTGLCYRITTVDWQGNESLPSLPLQARTAAAGTTPFRLVLEAESGRVSAPIQIERDAGASGRRFVHVPQGTSAEPYVLGGSVVLSFELPDHGVYSFWARVRAPDGGSNSFFHALNGQELCEWSIPITTEQTQGFAWQRIPALQGIPLAGGSHTLRIESREDGTCLDAIAVGNRHDDEPPF